MIQPRLTTDPLAWLSATAARWRFGVVALYLLLSGLAGWLTATHLAVDTDTTDMIDSSVPFRQHYNRFVTAFPDLGGSILALVEADEPELARSRAQQLAEALRNQPTAFIEVSYLPGMEFFRRNALLYLSTDELDQLAARLSAAQPMIASLASRPDMTGMAALFDSLAAAKARNLTTTDDLHQLEPLAQTLAGTIDSQTAGRPHYLSWQTLFTPGDVAGNDKPPYREVVVVRPVLDPGALLPAARAIAELRKTADTLGFDRNNPPDQARLSLTGGPVLAQQEMETVIVGASRAGILSLVLVALILGFGLRSLSLIVATLINLVVGLVITAGLAAITVGTLNLISVAFAVLFVGLAVDFGIHFALRYQEMLGHGPDRAHALAMAAGRQGAGVPLLLSAMATLIGFLAFLPTDYRGLAELGVISALGMAVALSTTFTLLPALLAILPAPRAYRLGRLAAPDRLIRRGFSERHAGAITLGGLVLLLACLPLAAGIRFDVNPLNLRDPASESVRTFRQLAENTRTTPYRISLALDDPTSLPALRATLAAQSDVGDVIAADSFIPVDQPDKLDRLYDLDLLIGPSLQPPPRTAAGDEETATPPPLRRIHDDLAALGTLDPGFLQLDQAIAAFTEHFGDDTDAIRQLDQLVGHFLTPQLQQIAEALQADTVTLDDLPSALHQDWINDQGQWRVDILPRQPISSNAELKRFAASVMAIAPTATGTPIIVTEASKAVAQAFIEATILTLALIGLLLLVVQRSLSELLLTLYPLFAAAILTVSASVLIGQAFNFANIIALPLLFALGVCGAIHMVWRQRQLQSATPESLELALGIDQTSTPRAILLSALTTVASFGSLAISPHPGTASMGLLLMLAISFTLLTTLFLLPAAIAWQQQHRHRKIAVAE